MFHVSTEMVRRWAARGKLKAHLKPRKVWHVDGIPYESKGERWLFFLKEDVDAMMGDPEYRKRHAAYVYGLSVEAREKREAKRLAELDRQLDVHERARRACEERWERQRRPPTP
jgi:hypothetical protein